MGFSQTRGVEAPRRHEGDARLGYYGMMDKAVKEQEMCLVCRSVAQSLFRIFEDVSLVKSNMLG